MKILVVGNIGAGKSSIAVPLAAAKSCPCLSIDDCRRLVSDGTPAGEMAAWAYFLRQVGRPGDAVIEFTGVGVFAPYVRETLRQSGARVLVIWLDVPPTRCLERIEGRQWDIPYPDFGVPLEEVVEEVQRMLTANVGENAAGWPGLVIRLDGDRPPDDVLQALKTELASIGTPDP